MSRRPAYGRKKRTPVTPAPSIQALPRAGIGVRLIALIYDSLLLVALVAVINVIVIAIFTPSAAAAGNSATLLSPVIRQGLMFPLSMGAIFCFYGYCWTRSGQTLGMQTWRLELRDLNGQRLSWKRSLQRFIAASALPLLSATASWLLHPHDLRVLAISVFAGLAANYLWALLPFSYGSGRSFHDQLSDTAVLRIPPTARKPYRFLGLFGDKSSH
ncbi:MAG: RDD family protein [Pseudomonadota bacterium]